MVSLNEKYVFHIPLSKFQDKKLIEIEIDGIPDELTCDFESFYITRAQSQYKSRKYDEILRTVFTSNEALDEKFRDWFFKNNDVLCQEEFGYEHNNTFH